MDAIARTPGQLGAAVRRARRQAGISQQELGSRIQLRQATISRLESGEPGTRLQTLIDTLAALDLELVVRPRTKGSPSTLADIF